MPAKWTMQDFFAGSGLVSYGLKGMFVPVWANDISEKKAAVYEANIGKEHFVLSDIRKIKGDSIPDANLSWASFPCQDLSLAGDLKGIHAERSGLVWEWLRIISELKDKPKILILENVTGLLSVNNGENYRVLHEALRTLGYKAGAVVINASLFVPQSRPRVFVIAVDKSCEIPQNIISNGPCWLHNKNAVELGMSLPEWIWWYTEKPGKRIENLEDILEEGIPYDRDDILGLIPERHLQKLNQMETVYATGYRRTRNGKSQLELRFDGIAGCLRTPQGGSSKQFLVVKKNHEIHARTLTVRETARLMGAPDDYKLPGTYNDGYLAMGDAVAMPVTKFLGERFLSTLAKAVY